MAELRRLSGVTSDPAEADAFLSASDGHFAFSADPGAGFRFAMEQVGDADVAVAALSIGGQWSNEGDFDKFCIASVTRGSQIWGIGGQEDQSLGRPFLLQPGQEFSFRADDIDVTNVYLSADGLREAARVAYGDDRIEVVFDGPRTGTELLGAHVRALVSVATEYLRAGRLENPLLRASLFHSLAMSALVSFRLSHDLQDRRLSPRDELLRFRLAAAFIEEYASLPITPNDVAGATGATLAQLDAAFRQHTGGSLAAYRQRIRLSAAREDLLGGGSSLGIDEVAARWGFPDTTRFVRRYRDAYGEAPEMTV